VNSGQAFVLGESHSHFEGTCCVHVAANQRGTSPLFARM
jgi:hypothetical protein